MESVEKFAAASAEVAEELRYKSGKVWDIPFVFDTMSLVDLDCTELIYNLSHLNDPDFPKEKKNPLDFFALFIASFGEEQWKNIKRSLKEIGKGTFADATEFYFEAMNAAGHGEGVELKN